MVKNYIISVPGNVLILFFLFLVSILSWIVFLNQKRMRIKFNFAMILLIISNISNVFLYVHYTKCLDVLWRDILNILTGTMPKPLIKIMDGANQWNLLPIYLIILNLFSLISFICFKIIQSTKKQNTGNI